MPRGLGCGPAMIADLVKGLHDGRPVIVAFEIFDCKPGSEAALIHFFSAVFFDMKFVDALAQNANPLFGPAESGRECWPELTLTARPEASRARKTSSWSRWLGGSTPSKPACFAALNFSSRLLPGSAAYQMPFLRGRFINPQILWSCVATN